jgi:hypothetical protein
VTDSTLTQTIQFDDYFVEIHHNSNLSKNPYLIRVFGYHNECKEIRLESGDLSNLYNILKEREYI